MGGGKAWQMGGQSMDRAAGLAGLDEGTPPYEDVHGPARSGGLWAAPRLLPVLAAAAPAAASFSQPPSAIQFFSFGKLLEDGACEAFLDTSMLWITALVLCCCI